MTTGFPRPKAEWEKTDLSNGYGNVLETLKLPIPWIGENENLDGQLIGWTDFDDARCKKGHMYRLCQVCGKKVKPGPIVHLIINFSSSNFSPRTSGCGVHIKCALVALKFCPHFTRRSIDPGAFIVWTWDGPGQGYETVYESDDDGRNTKRIDWTRITSGEPAMREGGKLLTLQQLKELSKK